MVTLAELNALRTRINDAPKRLTLERRLVRWNRAINALTDCQFEADNVTRQTHKYEHRVMTGAEQQAIYDKILTAVTTLEGL